MKLPSRVAVTAVTDGGRRDRRGRLWFWLRFWFRLRLRGQQKPAAAVGATPLGGYPSFLPKSTLHQPTDSVLTGTAQRPALANEGDAVRVKASGFSVLVTVTGPQVPGEGLPFQAAQTPAPGW